MSEADYEARYVEKLSTEDRELRHRRAVRKLAEPLLRKLPAKGPHHFPAIEFRALVQFLFEGEPSKIKRAMLSGRFKISGLEFVLKHREGECSTLSAFARKHGVPQQTLHDRVGRAFLKMKIRCGKKLFYVEDLMALLPDTRR